MRQIALVVLAFVTASAAGAQQSDTSRCDAVIAAARVDSQSVGLFLAAHRADGPALDPGQERQIIVSVGPAFEAPRPLRLNVFSGPALTRSLRLVAADTATALRSPTITGVYRVTASDSGLVSVMVIRASLVRGFDSAAVDAIRTGAIANPAFVAPWGEDTMRVDISFSTDSSTGARRLVSASFPRMPVVDATPLPGNKPAEFPEAARTDSVAGGEVVLRFVVGRDGTPEFDTIELVRASGHPAFTRAALRALATHRFRPATIHGCAIAQQIDYAFNFSLPDNGHG
jgi:TonB family protein